MHVIVVACPHPLCCLIYTALVSLLFGTPYIIQLFYGNISTLVSLIFVLYLLANTMLFACVRAPPLLLLLVLQGNGVQLN